MSEDNKDGYDQLINRSQGVLTSTERDVLLSDEQFEPRGREARSRVRRRLRDAMFDYIILDEGLPQKDLEQVFGWDETDGGDLAQEITAKAVSKGLRAHIRFVYRAAKAGRLDPEGLIQDAVDEAKGDRIDQLAQQYDENPESLTLSELSDLYKAGEIPEEEYEKLFREAIAEPEPRETALGDLANYLGRRSEE